MSTGANMETTIESAAQGEASNDELSDVELEEDRSSSLSDIVDKDAEQERNNEASDDLSDPEDDNDSEASTERLEVSPNKIHRQKDVVLNSHNQGQVHERSPSKLQNQIIIPNATGGQDQAENNDSLSDGELSVHESSTGSRKSSPKDTAHTHTDADTTAIDSIENSTEKVQKSRSVSDTDSRKRKRSILAGDGLEDNLEEPLRKRTGSIKVSGDAFAVEDEPPSPKALLNSAISIMSKVLSHGPSEGQDETVQSADEMAMDVDEQPDVPPSPQRRERKKRKPDENGAQDEDSEGAQPVANGEDPEGDNGENEPEDDAEAAARTEEEVEKNRVALEKFNAMLPLVNMLQDKLHNERLERLNEEEAMLRQDKPTHPEYLAMMKCIEERRDEKVRIADQLREFRIQTMNISAKANRAQILTQYQQDVRAIREKYIERLGREWYEIQHDRRTFAGTPTDYGLRMPTKRSEQVRQHVAYTNEVSVLAGVAKHIGFPAAPQMNGATAAEYEEDMERMGRTRHQAQMAAAQPFQELAAMRSAGPTSRLQPAEEQFLEQTPWANPRHSSHANHPQRQGPAQQAPRTNSPFPSAPNQQRRHSHQPGMGVPISGTFSSSSAMQQSNGVSLPGGPGRVSPHNPFSNNSQNRMVVPSPLGPLDDRSTSLSPQQTRPPGGAPSTDQQQNVMCNGNLPGHGPVGTEVHHGS